MMKNIILDIFFAASTAVLLILASAGFGLSYLVFVAFLPLLLAVKRANVNPLLLGWITGIIYFFTGLSWMMITFSYFGGAPFIAALGLLSGVSLVGGFIFFAPFTYIAKRYPYNALLLAMVFVALEAAKSALFFGGVPWLNLAQTQYKTLLSLQFVSIFGEFGLSFIIMVINVLLFSVIINHDRKRTATALAISLIIMIAPGVYRFISPLKVDSHAEVLIIQTGYKQEMKWERSQLLNIINNINTRLMSADRKKYNLILLPETAYPVKALDTPFVMDVLSDISFDTPILLGTDRAVMENGTRILYNSMALIKDGKPSQIYDKMHLTPFGEYFPFENLLKPVKEFFFGPGAMFTAGKTPKVFDVGDIKIAPLICFEGAFSNLLHRPIAMGANLIAIISNDTWFGKNQGRLQHLAVDTLRSVEYGKASIRATQDGISAVILPNGEIPIMVTEQIPAEISYNVPIVSFRTFYSYIGNMWVFFIIPFIYYLVKRKNKRLP